jgi:hypothetical protein
LRNTSFSQENYFPLAGSDVGPPSLPVTMLNFLKNILGKTDPLQPPSPVAYPRPMAEMVEYLILLQTCGTAPSSGRKGNLLRLGSCLSEDAYCLGYLNGMFDCLCEQWEVPVSERKLVIGTAFTLLFRDLLDECCDPRCVGKIEDTAFNGLHAFANDPIFLRGKFDGCSELTRYTATKEQAHMPERLHERLKQLAVAA